MSSPAVTWLIPVKDGMPYLRETLASIAGQTVGTCPTIVWDNGSTDGSVDEARAWIPQKIPGRVVVDRPLPLGEARGALVEAAETEFCAWIDADDINDLDRLARQVPLLESRPDLAMLGGNMRFIREDGSPADPRPEIDMSYSGVLTRLLTGGAIYNPATLFRRSEILAIGNYRHFEDSHEDLDVWLRVAAAGKKLVGTADPVISYRLRESGYTGSLHKAEAFQARLDATVRRNVMALLGVEPEWLRPVQERKEDPAWPKLVTIAERLGRLDGLPARERVASAAFDELRKRFVDGQDAFTRMKIYQAQGRWSAAFRFWRRHLARKFGGGHGRA